VRFHVACAYRSRTRVASESPALYASRARERGTPRRERAGFGKLKSRAGPLMPETRSHLRKVCWVRMGRTGAPRQAILAVV
jgi:hypothetical protein